MYEVNTSKLKKGKKRKQRTGDKQIPLRIE